MQPRFPSHVVSLALPLALALACGDDTAGSGTTADDSTTSTSTSTTSTSTTGPGTTTVGPTGTMSATESGSTGSTGTTDEPTTDPSTTSTGTTEEPTTTGTTAGVTMTDTSTSEPAPACDDGELNGDETDVDCGGPDCAPCEDGLMCVIADDCQSQQCDGGICIDCDDGEQNGDETDVDCGGPTCPGCEDGQMCLVDDDCINMSCVDGVCGPDNMCGDGCLVVASTAGTVYIYEPVNLTLVDTYPGFNFPQSVAAGTDGLLYVGESGQLRTVDILDKSTNVIGNGVVSGFIYGTTIGPDDRIYASGSGMGHIQMLELNGANAGTIASPGGSNLRSTAFGPNGDLYLSSFGGGPGQHWTPGPNYQGVFGGGGLGSAFGVATRSNGDVIINSQNNASYYVFQQDGTYIKSVPIACNGQVRNIATNVADFLYVGCHGSSKIVVYDDTDMVIDEVAVASPSGVSILAQWPG